MLQVNVEVPMDSKDAAEENSSGGSNVLHVFTRGYLTEEREKQAHQDHIVGPWMCSVCSLRFEAVLHCP